MGTDGDMFVVVDAVVVSAMTGTDADVVPGMAGTESDTVVFMVDVVVVVSVVAGAADVPAVSWTDAVFAADVPAISWTDAVSVVDTAVVSSMVETADVPWMQVTCQV